jgi:virginiamycin B lyase
MRKLLSAACMVLLGASTGYAAGTISGTVKGPDGAAFKGAFVRAQHVKTKVTTSVLSDKDGNYWVDLAPGEYEVRVQSIGFRSDPARRTGINVADAQMVSINFALQPSTVQWSQLTKYQGAYLLPPGPNRDVVRDQCFSCHGMGKMGAVGRPDKTGWLDAIARMPSLGGPTIKPEIADKVSDYMAAVFGPDSDTPLSPAKLPDFDKVKRDHDSFSDEALRAVYVDYSLANSGDPGDRPGTGYPDKFGNVWMEMEGGLAKLNPANGELKVFRLAEPHRHSGIHEVMPTADGASVWLTVSAQNSLVRFDTKSEKFDPVLKDEFNGPIVPQQEPNTPWAELRMSPGGQGGAPRTHTAVMDLDGNIWGSGRPLKKLDVKTGKFTNFPDVPDTYGITLDKQGNVWFAEFNSRDHWSVGKVDPKTNKVTKYTPPDGEVGRPRRIKFDSHGHLWIGQYFDGAIAEFDPQTEKFSQHKLPGPMPTVYGLGVDPSDNVWYASMYTDVIGRIDGTTGKIVEFPSPYGERATRDMWPDAQGRMYFGNQPYRSIGSIWVRPENAKPAAVKGTGN